MIPRLFEKDETAFTTFGICLLHDAIVCQVTEERNGEYALYMEYPRDGFCADEIIVDRIIYANPHDNATRPQPFRIYEVTFDMVGNLVVQAQHISYQLNHIIAFDYGARPSSPTVMWNGIEGARVTAANPFSFNTDIAPAIGPDIAVSAHYAFSIRDAIGGFEHSMLYIFGGELEWDMYDVNLWAARGADNGVKIAYTKNLTGMTYDIDISDSITAAIAYWQKDGATSVRSNIQTVPRTLQYNHVAIVDASGDFDTAPTRADLNDYASAWLARNKNPASLSVEVSFVPLWQTEEYKEYAALEHVALCDTVEVIYPPLNIDVQAKVVKTVYNVLADRYDELTISTIKKSLADTICDLMKG